VPTNHERLVWGQGDGRGLEAVETGFGRLGGLICWENYMPLARVALYESGVEIYVASTADDGDAWQQTLVHIARESRAYVVAPAHFQRESAYPEDFPLAAEIEGVGTIGRGGSAILAPDGSYLAGPLYDEEAILYAELDPARLLAERQRFDRSATSAGRRAPAHSSRGRCDDEYTSFRAIFPSLSGKTSTPSHSFEPVDAVHCRPRSRHRRRATVAKRRVGLLRKIWAMCCAPRPRPSARSSAVDCGTRSGIVELVDRVGAAVPGALGLVRSRTAAASIVLEDYAGSTPHGDGGP
jgi:hypothetical protein